MLKDKWINIRCTDQEREELTKDAHAHDMTVAEYIRFLVEEKRKEEKNC